RTHAPQHFLPSNFGYVRACEVGMGWGIHPTGLIGPQLAHGSLVQLLPGMALDMPLFWTHPRSAQAALERLTHCVMAAARQWLEPENPI
ncbi:MAG TPA: ArgP/LysG family DNA-binding transcriptional regulator, partial [Alicycliphilus sp.]|nr:ArgP/LysG family DNA-binding transcriptional regulator [Alicycliphilus sp.]